MNLCDRFLSYVAIPTAADPDSGTHPSSARQLVLADRLAEELREMGLRVVGPTEDGYVYGILDATVEGAKSVGFIAHMDTAPDAPGENIAARVVKYEGGEVILNAEKNIVLSPLAYPSLKKYEGKHLVVTDGTTLLGADDKAGVAEIMSALSKIVSEGAPHGKICVAFTPDEEIGEGADGFDVELFGADFAYTVDGGTLGEVEYENFNAAAARVSVNGISIHPGTAKGKMKNAARILCEFDSLLPSEEIPELTEGYQGFHHMTHITGSCEEASADYIIRDHSRALFEKKKEYFRECADLINRKYGEGTLELTLTDSYYNMREIIERDMTVVRRALSAMKECGIEPIVIPIRGGTDGARLSFMGLPCPNLSTGAENAHSRFEFAVVEDMEKMCEVIIGIVKRVARGE